MHIHLDPVGGIAGDMFAAALLDAWPDLEADLLTALAASGLDRIASVRRAAHDDGVLTGSRFETAPADETHGGHAHRHYSEVVALLEGARLAPAVRARALDMFRLLGEAEAKVHGVPVEKVSFHEVGAWDSIADVVSAAWLVDALGDARWSCASIPMGRGRVHTAHGELPVPAPATAILLEGFALHDDGRDGERVTPTGAAILRHLAPEIGAARPAMRLERSGIGFGTRRLEGMSNVLRVLAFTEAAAGLGREPLAVCAFEVDDQTPEDLAVALERLRALPGVLDVSQAAWQGKKGRLSVHVQLLARPDAADAALAACLDETTTLGVRVWLVERASLARDTHTVSAGGRPVAVKETTRPRGTVTRKAEMADIASVEGGHAARQRVRRAAESGSRD